MELNIEKYGTTALTHSDMVETSGGCFWVIFIIIGAILIALD